MATTQQPPAPPAAPELKTASSIPSLAKIQDTLLAWKPTAYEYSVSFKNTAISYSEPIQGKLAPLISTVDDYGRKSLDAAQQRFPALKTETIKARRDSVYKSTSELAHNVDTSLTPIVDRLEVLIHKFKKEETAEEEEDEEEEDEEEGEDEEEDEEEEEEEEETTQVRRAYRLSIDLKDQLLILSSEQIKQLQSQSVILQRAQESIHTLNSSLTPLYLSARDKSAEFVTEKKAATQEAAHRLLAELEKYQAMTPTLPKQVQESLKPVQDGIQASLSEISKVMKSQMPTSEKVTNAGKAVQENIQPLLKQATVTVQAYVDQGKAYLSRKKTPVAEATPIAEKS